MRDRSTMKTNVLWLLSMHLLLFALVIVADINNNYIDDDDESYRFADVQDESNRCSWIGSGANDEQTVRVIRLQCNAGRVLWKRPLGALLIRIFTPIDNRPWQICIRTITTNRQQPHYVRLFRKENATLTPLDNRDDEQCMSPTTNVDRISLFMQSEHDAWLMSGSTPVGFYYSISAMNDSKTASSSRVLSTCIPCSTTQLLDAFCSVDFVFRGRLLRAIGNTSSFEFSVGKILRKPLGYEDYLSKFRPKSTLTIAMVYITDCIPAPIDGHIVSGEHMVMAVSRLGRAELRCAPLLSDFNQLIAHHHGQSACELS